MSIFGGSAANPYDDIVAKTTDENLTSENWELILNLCDKVEEEGEEGARQVIAALLKRLTHRNPNVQLYTLTLAESLSKNVGLKINREIASRAFTQGLERIITDRNSHEKVRQRALQLIAEWTAEFEADPSLGVMEECYNSLKSKNYKFVAPTEPPPPAVDDEIRRKEEEELQRVLEMSMQDKGGRDRWAQYSLAASSGAGSSSNVNSATAGPASSANLRSTANAGSSSGGSNVNASGAYTAPKYQGGYQPARTPSPKVEQQAPSRQSSYGTTTAYAPQSQPPYTGPSSTAAATENTVHNNNYTQSTPTSPSNPTAPGIVTRVRALHTFEPTEPGELAFEKGDIIKVVDRGYKDWWRGQLKGRTGIFPVNYVEPLPEPTAAELAKEAEQEAAVFAQAVNVEKLLNMLRTFDPAKDNLADNEEIQELYRSSMALRPKIVKLIDKYSQKRADLVSMNETFVRARTIFDRMMEESLARHTGVYDQGYRPPYATPRPDNFPTPVPGRPDSRGATAAGRTRPEYSAPPAAQPYGWNHPAYEQPGYNAFPAPSNSYTPGPTAYPSSGATPAHGSVPAVHPTAVYSQPGQQSQQQGGYPVPQGGYSGQQPNAPYGLQGPNPYPAQSQQGAQPQQPTQQSQGLQSQYPIQAQVQPLVETHVQSQASLQPQIQPQTQPQPQAQPQIQPQSQSQTQPQTQTQPRPQPQPQPQSQSSSQVQLQSQATAQGLPQSQPVESHAGLQGQSQFQQTQAQQQPALQHAQSGPPYIFNPKVTYSDPNVQAWAQYYAQGGRDLAGAVYFVSIPGLTDTPPKSPNATGIPVQQGQGQEASLQTLNPQSVGSAESLSLQMKPQQTQPHGAKAYQPPQGAENNVTPGYGITSSPTIQPQQHPVQQSASNYVPPNAGQSTPQATSSTPAWVLPKKTDLKPEAAGSSSYSMLPGQFSGMNIADPTNSTQPSAST